MEENIGELTIRAKDTRDIVFSGIVKNMDNITEDSEGFAPVRKYVQAECFEVDTCNRLLTGTFKDTYNQQNGTNKEYDITIVLIAE
jgi:hypothetical protein